MQTSQCRYVFIYLQFYIFMTYVHIFYFITVICAHICRLFMCTISVYDIRRWSVYLRTVLANVGVNVVTCTVLWTALLSVISSDLCRYFITELTTGRVHPRVGSGRVMSFVRSQLAARVAQFVRGIRTFVDRNAHMRGRLYCVLRVETL